MLDWCARHGKCMRQISVRQQNTKFKSGTLPLNMYAKPLGDDGDYQVGHIGEQERAIDNNLVASAAGEEITDGVNAEECQEATEEEAEEEYQELQEFDPSSSEEEYGDDSSSDDENNSSNTSKMSENISSNTSINMSGMVDMVPNDMLFLVGRQTKSGRTVKLRKF